MAKAIKCAFMCNECSADYLRWQGRCIVYRAWNTIEVHLNSTPAPTCNKRFIGYAGDSGISKAQKLSEISLKALPQFSTGFKEFDRVLGGSMMPTLCKLAKNENSVCHRRKILTTGGDACVPTRSAYW